MSVNKQGKGYYSLCFLHTPICDKCGEQMVLGIHIEWGEGLLIASAEEKDIIFCMDCNKELAQKYSGWDLDDEWEMLLDKIEYEYMIESLKYKLIPAQQDLVQSIMKVIELNLAAMDEIAIKHIKELMETKRKLREEE